MKNIIILFIILWGFSAKAQVGSYLPIQIIESDVYYALENKISILSEKVHKIVTDKKMKIYADSSFKNMISDAKINDYFEVEMRMYKDKDGNEIYVGFNPSSFNFNIHSNYIEYYIFKDLYFYIPTQNILPLLQKDEKDILDFCKNNLNGKWYKNQTQLAKLSEKIYSSKSNDLYNLFKDGKVKAYWEKNLKSFISSVDLEIIGSYEVCIGKKTKPDTVFNRRDETYSINPNYALENWKG